MQQSAEGTGRKEGVWSKMENAGDAGGMGTGWEGGSCCTEILMVEPLLWKRQAVNL